MFTFNIYTLLWLTLIVISLIFLWLQQLKQYWVKRSIVIDKQSLLFRLNRHIAFVFQDIYKRWKYTDNLFVGIFMGPKPAVLLLDLDLIKSILITDFDSFPNRGFYHNIKDDPLSGNIVRLEDQEWRRMRVKLSPTFSSGKMKYMFPTVVQVAKRFAVVLQESLCQPEMEMRDMCARFTTDVIGSVAFGIECDSLKYTKTEFRVAGDKTFASFRPIVETFAYWNLDLARRLHIKAFPQTLIDFYSKIVTENIDYRETNAIRRNDFLDILLELRNAKENGEFGLTLNEIIAQSFVFFTAGFETSSSTMSFCLYELSLNQEIQQKARQSVQNALQKYNNELNYECLQDMHYLNQVLMETLRKYPVAPNLKRITGTNYKVPGTQHILEKGVEIIIPIYSLHHDPEYFPQPSVFNPDRFSPMEIEKRHAMTYLPFGAGPRICIAERFGKMQALIGLAMLLNHFQFTISPKTPRTLEYDFKNVRTFSVKGGIHLHVEKL